MTTPFRVTERGRLRPSIRRPEAHASRSANGEEALHARFGMPRHRAAIGVLALLRERHHEPRRRARLDQRRLLAGDPEVVLDVADVLEDERHLAGLRSRLGRELEEELAAS